MMGKSLYLVVSVEEEEEEEEKEEEEESPSWEIRPLCEC